jgi:putative oxidoreductase
MTAPSQARTLTGDASGKSRNSAMAAIQLTGRILIGAIFLLSGASKIAQPAATIDAITAVGLPLPELGLVIAILVETVVTAAFIAGYRTRLMAAILVAYCFATAIFFHNQWSDLNQLMHFLKNMAMAGGLLQIAALGAGRFSLDARKPNRRSGARSSMPMT